MIRIAELISSASEYIPAIWTGLPTVQAGNVHRLPDGIWLFGGVDSVTAYLDALVAALSPTP